MSTADNPNTPPRPQRIISSVIIQNTSPQRVWDGDHPARIHLPVFLWLTS